MKRILITLLIAMLSLSVQAVSVSYYITDGGANTNATGIVDTSGDYHSTGILDDSWNYHDTGIFAYDGYHDTGIFGYDGYHAFGILNYVGYYAFGILDYDLYYDTGIYGYDGYHDTGILDYFGYHITFNYYSSGIWDGVSYSGMNNAYVGAGGTLRASNIGTLAGTDDLTPPRLKKDIVVDDVTGTLQSGSSKPGFGGGVFSQ